MGDHDRAEYAAGRQPSQRAGGIVEVHTVLTPGLPEVHQPKRLAAQRVEWMSDPQTSVRTVWSVCSRLL